MFNMKSLGIRSYDSLYECDTVKKVKSELDKLGIPPEPEKRIKFLKQFMGVEESFKCGESPAEEDYYVACEDLIFINKQRNAGVI